MPLNSVQFELVMCAIFDHISVLYRCLYYVNCSDTAEQLDGVPLPENCTMDAFSYVSQALMRSTAKIMWQLFEDVFAVVWTVHSIALIWSMLWCKRLTELGCLYWCNIKWCCSSWRKCLGILAQPRYYWELPAGHIWWRLIWPYFISENGIWTMPWPNQLYSILVFVLTACMMLFRYSVLGLYNVDQKFFESPWWHNCNIPEMVN